MTKIVLRRRQLASEKPEDRLATSPKDRPAGKRKQPGLSAFVFDSTHAAPTRLCALPARQYRVVKKDDQPKTLEHFSTGSGRHPTTLRPLALEDAKSDANNHVVTSIELAPNRSTVQLSTLYTCAFSSLHPALNIHDQ